MTIRVRCDGCSAVMKVKDELAGAKGKCPKCKATFVIPAADESDQPTSDSEPKKKKAAAEKKIASEKKEPLPIEEPVDQPLYLTPPVPVIESDDFDPMSALTGGSSAAMPAMSGTPISEPVSKPSIAVLMQEHEEKKDRRSRRKEKAKKSKAEELAQPAMTAGTAADALNRKYDQKRDDSSADAPTMSREERREVEQKEAMIHFAKRAVPAVAGVLLLSYFLIGMMLGDTLPPLGYVEGRVTLNGAPMADAVVTFVPRQESGGAPLEDATTSTGTTDSNGEFTMKYNADHEGVIPGNHTVSIETSMGVQYTVPTDQANRTVNVDESHEFDFSF